VKPKLDRPALLEGAAMTVGLVSCTKSKLDEAAPARELYSPSWVFTKSVEYVEERCDEWLVLSAKHGLVEPDEVIEPYDETLAGTKKATKDEWATRVREQLKARYEGKRVKFVLMAGESYAGAVEGIEQEAWIDAKVEQPMKGMSTGFRRRWLAQNT
jgi:predicted transcriptional regulator